MTFSKWQDYQPREHWTLRIPGWRFALYLLIGYVLACSIGACDGARTFNRTYITAPDTVTAPVDTTDCHHHHHHHGHHRGRNHGR